MSSSTLNAGKTVLTKASGEVKVINSAVHAFIASHPFWASVIALAVGNVVGVVFHI